MPLKTVIYATFTVIDHETCRNTIVTLDEDVTMFDSKKIREYTVEKFKRIKDALATVFVVSTEMRIWVEKSEAEKSIEVLQDFSL